jgi:hypothetical protein
MTRVLSFWLQLWPSYNLVSDFSVNSLVTTLAAEDEHFDAGMTQNAQGPAKARVIVSIVELRAFAKKLDSK